MTIINDPQFSTASGAEEVAADAASFDIKLNAEMKDLGDLTLISDGQSIGQFKQYDSAGNQVGDPIDIFTVAGLGDNRYGELNHWDESTHNPNKRAARHAAWYDKKLPDIIKSAGTGNDKKLRLYGKVIGSGDSEFETDDIHQNVKDPVTGNTIDFTQFNVCVPWLTTFGADYNISPHDMWAPDASKPNVTIEKNSYTEIKLTFSGYQASAFRTSLWLIPATRNNDPGITVKHGDSNILDANGNQNFVKDPYHAAEDPADGVEVDIFEYERTVDSANHDWLIMKCLGELGDQDKWTHNVHTNGPGVNGADGRVPGIDNTDFHRIGLLWVEDRLVWFVDGVAYVKDVVNVPNNVRMQLVLSRELTAGNNGAGSGTPSDPGIFGDSGASSANRNLIDGDYVEIEHIRVWEVSNYSEPNSTADVTADRYGATNGEIFWDKGGYTNFNVYRDDQNQGSTNGSSFYQNDLVSGQSYDYEVKAIDGGNEISIGSVTMPSDTGGSVTATRYGATNGEIFWDKGGYTNFKIYRNNDHQGDTNGSSFYQNNLISGLSYSYEVKAVDGGSEISIGTVTMPAN